MKQPLSTNLEAKLSAAATAEKVAKVAALANHEARLRVAFGKLVERGEKGATAGTFHKWCESKAAGTCTQGRLKGWEKHGLVKCNRNIYPHVWVALKKELPVDVMHAPPGDGKRSRAALAKRAEMMKVLNNPGMLVVGDPVELGELPIMPWVAQLMGQKVPRPVWPPTSLGARG